MSAYLGVPYRVFYEARFERTGLTGIYAYVKRPDLQMMGSYSFMESTEPVMAGLYYFDFLTNEDYPEGVYIVSIVSPTEGSKNRIKIEMYRRPSGSTQENISITTTPRITFESTPQTPPILEIDQQPLIHLTISENQTDLTIESERPIDIYADITTAHLSDGVE